MAQKIKEIILLGGEEIIYEIEGNAYTESPNPLVRSVAFIVRIIGKLFGISLRTYIVITNKRVLKVDKEKIFWVIPRNIVVKTISKSSIKEVGYSQAIRWLLFKTLYFQMQTMTENIFIAYEGTLNEVNSMVSRVAEIIST